MPVETATLPKLDNHFLQDVPLTRRATFYPLGFPLELVTNSEAVIAAAHQSWGMFGLTYPEAKVKLSVTVSDREDDCLPPRPVFRAHQHLMSIVSDAGNHAICDLSRGSGVVWVTQRVAENADFLRLRFLESSVMTTLVARYLAPIHSALISRNGVGVALCGESFAGKSTLSYASARCGWTFISDDGTFLLREGADRYAVGNPHSVRFREDAKFLFPELENYRVGLRPNGELGMEVRTSELPVATANGCSIDHLVFLRRSRSGPARVNRFNPDDALAWFESVAFYGPADVQAAQRQAYKRLLKADVWELHYSDLSDAIQLLDQLEVVA
jgi:hypothetical protein